MNKKSLRQYLGTNLSFGIMTIFSTLTFMMQICSALITIKGGGVLNNIDYTLFQLKISITRDTYSHVYTIGNYPLIPIVGGLIYNSYIMLKNHKIKNKVDS